MEGPNTTKKPKLLGCRSDSERQCLDGTCISRMDLCPEEEMINQDTILIMIGIGMGVVLFLIMLYCFQQRRNGNNDQQDVNLEDGEPPELLMPPPAYEEAVNVSLYPPTPLISRRISLADEPTTPPPNYDAALHILAQSHENILIGKEAATPDPESPMLRRAISLDALGINRARPMTFSSFGANAKTFGKPSNANRH